jgi:hypothetical protein
MVCSAVGGWLLRLANNVLLMAATAHGSALVEIVHHVRSASICSMVSKGECGLWAGSMPRVMMRANVPVTEENCSNSSSIVGTV